MASLACQSEDGNNAVFIGTNLENGDSQTLCLSCMVQFFTGVLEALASAQNGDQSEQSGSATYEEMAPEFLAEQERSFKEWLDGNADRLLELMETGSTEQEAIAQLLEHDANVAHDNDNDSTDNS